MEKQKVEEQIDKIKNELIEKEIENIYLLFIDFSGRILTKMVGVKELINNTHVSWFDGITINGTLLEDFKEDEKSDWLVLLPDPFSFRIIPFLKEEHQKSTLIFCSIKNNPLDTRGILKRAVKEFKNIGMLPYLGTQFIYGFEGNKGLQNFYETFVTNNTTIFQNQLVNELLKANIDIEYYMPYGETHNRIDLVPDIASVAADKLWTTKWFANNLSKKYEIDINYNNLDYSYLSSCPIHISIWKGIRERNLFFDENDQYELSSLAKDFINGILYHQKFLKALAISNSLNPLKTYEPKMSIKRDNSLIQIPLYFNEKQKKDRIGWSKRCVYNGLNADNNYYLMFAAILYAGLYGIQNKVNISQNTYTKEESKDELLDVLKSNEYLKEKLGEKIINKAITKLRNKLI